MSGEPEACEVAHGAAEPDSGVRTLVAVFASPVSRYLLKFARDLGFRVALFEPDAARATDVPGEFEAATTLPPLDGSADVVVTDHHRHELGEVLKLALEQKPRWIGVLGNPRHPGPHLAALRALGVPDAEIDRVHRPVGLNIGSRTPPEIAIATLAGLLADRNNRPGGFDF
ncbi:XdhC family protein [Amycolatopsis sp., V23-08]|uniref:XdhC family protein n=1 Tax=Amycolatopsis heterodermiae TaxID=3110235 RepID=A0ABU5RJ70_9PSEU|nr:XdhC family protein [Amycolatopsis sp., V23-08]MEA5365181.1 XdhC family protein [Amycolatopsis sp., V23-08]